MKDSVSMEYFLDQMILKLWLIIMLTSTTTTTRLLLRLFNMHAQSSGRSRISRWGAPTSDAGAFRRKRTGDSRYIAHPTMSPLAK